MDLLSENKILFKNVQNEFINLIDIKHSDKCHNFYKNINDLN